MPNELSPYKDAGARYVLALGNAAENPRALIVEVATPLSPEELEKAIRDAAAEFLASGGPRAKKAIEEANGHMTLEILMRWMDNDTSVRHMFQVHGYGRPFLTVPLNPGATEGDT